HPYEDGGPDRMREVMAAHGIDALIAIGGEGTLAGASRLVHEEGLHIVGVPKTIDNDLGNTDYTFGFDTAQSIATEAIDRLRTTAESHHRCMVIEVMGRNVGWSGLHAGMAAGAHAILGPGCHCHVDPIATWVNSSSDRGAAPIAHVREVFVREGLDAQVADQGVENKGRTRLVGIANYPPPNIEAITGIESRATI